MIAKFINHPFSGELYINVSDVEHLLCSMENDALSKHMIDHADALRQAKENIHNAAADRRDRY